jgi:PEP-CTERM motif
MKTEIRTLTATTALFLFAAVAQAQFNPGDLVVLRDGTGSGVLSSAGTAIFLDQYTTSGAFVNSQAIPTTGSPALVNSGTAASEGQLSLSANGQYLVLAGYNVAAGTTGVAGAASSVVPRGIATVDASGNYTLAATTASFYSGNNIRGGASDGNGNFWGAGPAATGGTVYLGTGTPAQIFATNSLAVQDIGGNLFYSTAKGTTGIYEFAGTPTSGIATPTLVLANATPSDFTFNANMTIAYVANTAGGIQRYDFNGTSWTLSYTLDSGTGMNGVAVNFSGTDPLIYATTEDGKNLIEITDAGSGSAATTLDTAGANEAFRGLDFSPQPVPEPSAWALFGLGLAGLWSFHRRNRKS